MKKKLVGFIVLVLSTLILVACSNDSLEGEYYWINKYRNDLEMTITSNAGSVDVDGKDYAIVKVDNENKQITVSTDYGNRTFNMKLTKEGKAVSPSDHIVYKKGSKACEEALKKYGYKEVGKE
ncbi:TPA: hypothetical protein ACJR8T_000483 [Streptococcus agalactiae]